jgi:excisionase family DNA binding protein
MREFNIEQRLSGIEDNVAAIKRMLEELLSSAALQSVKSDENEIMSVKQVAQFLGLDVNMIYLKCSKGDIPYFKIGRQYKFKKPEILNWIKEQKDHPDISVDDYVDRYMQKHILKS